MRGPDDDPTIVIPTAAVLAGTTQRRARRPLIGVLVAAVAAVVVFAASLAAVTLLETVKGGTLSGGTGLSIQGGNAPPGHTAQQRPDDRDGHLDDVITLNELTDNDDL